MSDTNTYYNEKLLFLRISEGDETAFAQVLRLHWKNVYSHALTYLKSTQRAEELTQDIFMRLWDAREKLPAVEQPENYLFIIARNALVSAMRKKLDTSDDLDKLSPIESNLQPDQQLEYKERYAILMQGIDLLPEKRREVFRLSRIEGLSHAEIAEKLGMHKDTVAQYIVKAVNFLKLYLSEKINHPIILIILLGGLG